MSEFSCEHAPVSAPQNFSRAFAIGITLNVAYVCAQVLFGIFGHSLALLADAGHNLGDVLGLLLAWGASHLVRRPSTPRRTYGWRRTSIMAALFNAIFLLVIVGGITWEALRRFIHQENVDANIIIGVAAVGIVINGITAWMFMSGRKSDLNIRGAFTHMAADAAVSGGVVLAGVAIHFSGWSWLDPATSILINIVIVIGTWSLLRESFNLATDAVPENVDLVAVKNYFAELPSVIAVHDLHIWAMSTTEIALTAHLVMPDQNGGDIFLREVCEHLHHKFGIEHATIQIEQNAEACSLA
ncbi:MAG: cation diffusion facilitator family transporter [Verrucomicrobiota bacterium]|nr:cation diffusion facilitator family transporter [Verrucomicrobiota bacterium]